MFLNSSMNKNTVSISTFVMILLTLTSMSDLKYNAHWIYDIGSISRTQKSKFIILKIKFGT